MTWLGAGGWVAFLSKMQSEDVLVRRWVGVGGRFGPAGLRAAMLAGCGRVGRVAGFGTAGLRASVFAGVVGVFWR